MNDKIRARLDSVCGDAFVIWPYANILGDALRAVLDLPRANPLGERTTAAKLMATGYNDALDEAERAIADALGCNG